jgi:hypothetical protein
MSLVDTYEKIAAADAERFEKLAEEDAAGRIMARGFMDELNKLAAPVATTVPRPAPPTMAPPRENPARIPGPSSGGPRQIFNSGRARSAGPVVGGGAAPTTAAATPRVTAPAAASRRPAIDTGALATKRKERPGGSFFSSIRNMRTRAMSGDRATSSGPQFSKGSKGATTTAPATIKRPPVPGMMR